MLYETIPNSLPQNEYYKNFIKFGALNQLKLEPKYEQIQADFRRAAKINIINQITGNRLTVLRGQIDNEEQVEKIFNLLLAGNAHEDKLKEYLAAECHQGGIFPISELVANILLQDPNLYSCVKPSNDALNVLTQQSDGSLLVEHIINYDGKLARLSEYCASNPELFSAELRRQLQATPLTGQLCSIHTKLHIKLLDDGRLDVTPYSRINVAPGKEKLFKALYQNVDKYYQQVNINSFTAAEVLAQEFESLAKHAAQPQFVNQEPIRKKFRLKQAFEKVYYETLHLPSIMDRSAAINKFVTARQAVFEIVVPTNFTAQEYGEFLHDMAQQYKPKDSNDKQILGVKITDVERQIAELYTPGLIFNTTIATITRKNNGNVVYTFKQQGSNDETTAQGLPAAQELKMTIDAAAYTAVKQGKTTLSINNCVTIPKLEKALQMALLIRRNGLEPELNAATENFVESLLQSGDANMQHFAQQFRASYSEIQSKDNKEIESAFTNPECQGDLTKIFTAVINKPAKFN